MLLKFTSLVHKIWRRWRSTPSRTFLNSSPNGGMGRILLTHTGNDGLVRIVTIKIKNGSLKRPITKLCLLFSYSWKMTLLKWAGMLESSLLIIIKLHTTYPVYPFDLFTNIYCNSVWIILLSVLVAILFDKCCLKCSIYLWKLQSIIGLIKTHLAISFTTYNDWC